MNRKQIAALKLYLRKSKRIAFIVATILGVLIISGIAVGVSLTNSQSSESLDTGVNTKESQPYIEPGREKVDQNPSQEDEELLSSDKVTDTNALVPQSQKPVTYDPGKPVGSNPESPPVAPNPYCPKPNIYVNVSRQSENDFNLIVTAGLVPGDPNHSPYCGGGVNILEPVVTHPPTGSFCSATVYPIENSVWGVACTTHTESIYGVYTYTFTVTATNGYNLSTTKSASYTYNYSQQ